MMDLSFTDQELTRDAWDAKLRALGDAHGFYEEIGDEHTALFVKSGKTLIISFENLGAALSAGLVARFHLAIRLRARNVGQG